jgi:hypothetical protein
VASDPASLDERLRAARIDRPKDYHLLPISLAAARNNELVAVAGTSLQLVSETDSSVSLTVRLGGFHNDPIPLGFRQGVWGIPFTQFHLSNSAQAGKSCALLIGTPAAGEVRIARDSPPLDAANPGYVKNDAASRLYLASVSSTEALYIKKSAYWPGMGIEAGMDTAGSVQNSGLLIDPVAGTVLWKYTFAGRVNHLRAYICCDSATPCRFTYQQRKNDDTVSQSEEDFFVGGPLPTFFLDKKPWGGSSGYTTPKLIVGENVTGRVIASARFTDLTP